MSAKDNTSKPTEHPTTRQTERRWAPRFWLGASFGAWARLLVRNRFAIGPHPFFWYVALVDTFASVINSVLGFFESAIYGRTLRRAENPRAPVFIIGHWRSGTTLLHELLILDDRHTFPNMYQCFSPNHFLISERRLSRWLNFLAPSHRPMDNMPVGWKHPQEEEFALCNMGLGTPYSTIAFPNRPPQGTEYFDLDAVPSSQREHWKHGLMRFFKKVADLNPGRRLILKSPPHTCRIKVLLEMFPDARFVHIVRDPLALFPSTVKLWKSLYRAHGFQIPRFEGLEEYVLETFANMHETLEATRGLVDPNRFFELRYEDLIADPIGQLTSLYEHFEFGGIENVRAAWEGYLNSVADYQPNAHALTAEQLAKIADRWAPYFRRYGYPLPSPAAAVATVSAEC